MKRFLLGSLVFCLGAVTPAFATGGGEEWTLPESLHPEPGDLTTPAEIQPPRQEVLETGSSTECLPGKGVSFTTRDRKYSLRFCGWIRTAYFYTNFDDDRRENSNAGNSDEDISTFDIVMTHLIAQGFINGDQFHYKFEIDPSDWNTATRRVLKDMWLQYRFWGEKGGDALYFRMGQYKVGFGRGIFDAGWARIFIYPSVVERNFGYARTPGGVIQGTFMNRQFNFMIGAYNGRGEDRTRDTNGTMGVARVWYDFMGPFSYAEGNVSPDQPFNASIGAAGLYDPQTSSASSDRIASGEVDFAVKGMGFYGQTSYFLRNEMGSGGNPDAQSWGWYVLGAYNFDGQNEVAARYGFMKLDDKNAHLTGAYGIKNYFKDSANTWTRGDVTEVSLAFTHYFAGQNVKASVEGNYRILDPNIHSGTDLPKVQDTGVSFQFQIRF